MNTLADTTSSAGGSFKNHEFVKFKCSCQKCCLLDYIRGEDTCYDQDPRNIPEIEICDTMPKDEKDRVGGLHYSLFVGALFDQTTIYHVKFIDLVEEMTVKMIKANIALDSVKSYLSIYLSHPSYRRYTRAMKEELALVTSFEELKKFLHDKLCSWYNYEIIAKMWKKFLVLSKDSKLKSYEDEFKVWVERRIFLFVKDLGPKTKGNHIIEVRCKVDVPFKYATHQELAPIERTFFKCVPKEFHHLVNLKCVEDGCTELVFRAPVDLEDIELTSESNRVLGETKILWIKIGENLLFEKCKDNSPVEVKNLVCIKFEINSKPSCK